MGLIGLIGILMLAGGLLIFIRGWRGKPVLSLPRCAKCGYDLRGLDPEKSPRCPECGSELAAKNAVSFGKFQKRPRMMLLGAILALLPLLLLGLVILQAALGIRWSDYRSNSSVIAGLATSVDSPWDWNELDRRLTRGKLSSQDVAAAIDQLIKHLNAHRPNSIGPLPWSDGFITRVDAAGLISDEQFARLCDAFYGKDLKVTMPTRIRAGRPCSFEIKYGGPWNFGNLELLKAFAGAQLPDGRKLELPNLEQQNSRGISRLSDDGPRGLSGELALPSEPGDYRVTLHADLGLVSAGARFSSGDGQPGPAKRWPPARRKWAKDVTFNVTVFPADQPLKLIEDPAQDPAAAGQISIETLKVAPQGSRPKSLSINFRCTPSIAMCFDIEVRMGQWTFTIGPVHKRAQYRGGLGTSLDANGVGPETTATVILHPNANAAAQTPEMESIWGKDIEFKDVPVERFDLDEQGG